MLLRASARWWESSCFFGGEACSPFRSQSFHSCFRASIICLWHCRAIGCWLIPLCFCSRPLRLLPPSTGRHALMRRARQPPRKSPTLEARGSVTSSSHEALSHKLHALPLSRSHGSCAPLNTLSSKLFSNAFRPCGLNARGVDFRQKPREVVDASHCPLRPDSGAL